MITIIFSTIKTRLNLLQSPLTLKHFCDLETNLTNSSLKNIAACWENIFIYVFPMPPKNFFNLNNKWNSDGVRSGLYGGWSILFHGNFYNSSSVFNTWGPVLSCNRHTPLVSDYAVGSHAKTFLKFCTIFQHWEFLLKDDCYWFDPLVLSKHADDFYIKYDLRILFSQILSIDLLLYQFR